MPNCVNCGETMPVGAVFCRRCGTRLPAAPIRKAPPPPAQSLPVYQPAIKPRGAAPLHLGCGGIIALISLTCCLWSIFVQPHISPILSSDPPSAEQSPAPAPDPPNLPRGDADRPYYPAHPPVRYPLDSPYRHRPDRERDNWQEAR